jgi:hypothetical protein
MTPENSNLACGALWQKLIFVTAGAILAMPRRTAVARLLGGWTAMPVYVTGALSEKLRRNGQPQRRLRPPVRLCAITKRRCASGTNLSNPSPEMTKVQPIEILRLTFYSCIILNGMPPCVAVLLTRTGAAAARVMDAGATNTSGSTVSDEVN